MDEYKLPDIVMSARLAAGQLYRSCDLDKLAFETTAQLTPADRTTGQERALDAILLSAHLDKPGFNLFAAGAQGAGLRETVTGILKGLKPDGAPPADWVYVNNFADARRPLAISLPPGRGPQLRAAMYDLIDDLKSTLPATFQSEEYQAQRSALEERFRNQQAERLTAFQDKARTLGIALLRTPLGFTLAPARNGEVVPPEEFEKWPEARKTETRDAIAGLERELEHTMRQVQASERAHRSAVRDLARQTTQAAVGHLIEEKKAEFGDLPTIIEHLDRVSRDLVENVEMFIAGAEASESNTDRAMMPGGPFDRYGVNILVTQAGRDDAVPIVEELHPTLSNLIGSVEHISRQGALLTNFHLIKAGAIHRANGGYLLLDARALLSEPFSWPALKRALRRGEILIEDVGQLIGLAGTISLEPDPIPLDLKVVIYGERMFYYLLEAHDPEFGEHFKILADFNDDITRTGESEAVHARLIAALLQEKDLKSMERDGVAAMIEHAARQAEHGGKLTMRVEPLRDVLIEADFWAGKAGHATIARQDVEKAIAQRIHRLSRVRERSKESILEQVALIETSGARIGQINGLSVLELGGFAFGRPTRITCQVRPGSGRLVDIEREAKLGGPIHTKGVMILAGFLSGRYALDAPLSLHASLVFEQSYGGVEGDSASSTELYALMSALSGLPLRQDLAVTGSVNQHGEIQAIGGVNEKIEGFFDICQARGLTGTQGVLIPRSNVQHLMLRKDVIEACAQGRFAIYAAGAIDEGIALLTGRNAGARLPEGSYPEGSVNRLIEERLARFAQVQRRFAQDAQKPSGEPAS